MARNNTVALSGREKKRLDDAREKIFGTDEVPYGVVITELCKNVE